MSREFFAAIVSLQQTGSLNDESLGVITNAIGSNVKAIEINDIYTYKIEYEYSIFASYVGENNINEVYLLCYHYRIISVQNCLNKIKNLHS